MSIFDKPLPRLKGLAGEWYGFAKQHDLRMQRCTNCGTWRHLPREMCAKCGSFDWEWAKVSGKGKIYTFTVTYAPFHPAYFNDPFPYAVVIVELEEGVRMQTNVVDYDQTKLEIGMPVEVYYDDVNENVTLVKWKVAK